MEIGKIEVSGNRARVSSRSSVTSGMVGATVAFAFDETWADMDKTLVWAGSGVTVDDTTASGVVPAEVVAKFGGRLKVGVYGTKEGTAIPTVWADLGPILPGADPSGDESTDPSLPVWAQLQQQMGFSPVVAVEDIDGGHRVTITDKNGAKQFDVMDGTVTDIVKTVNGISPDANGNVEIPVSGGNADQSGLTAEQISALDGMFKICAYTADATNAYKAFQTAFGIGGEVEPDVPVVPDEPDTEKTLTSISVVYSGGDVAVGTAVSDLTGIVVTAHYSDGTSETVTGYTLSGTIVEGVNTITVGYGGMTTTFTVTGTAESGGGEYNTNLLAGVEWTDGLRILPNGTEYTNQAGWTTSDYIAVTPSANMRFGNSGENGYVSLAVSYYTADKVAYGSGHGATLGHSDNNNMHYVDTTIPNDVAYVRICTGPANKYTMYAYEI